MPRVLLTAPAAEQLEEAREWWALNRDKAPHAVEDDVEALVSLLEERPELVGRPIEAMAGVRRVHLRRIRYYAYFQINAKNDTVDILAFWHERRESEPPL